MQRYSRVVLALVVSCVIVACSGSDDDAAGGGTEVALSATSAAPSTDTVATTDGAATDSSSATSTAPTTTGSTSDPDVSPDDSTGDTASNVGSTAPAPQSSLVAVPETGVPGLDSDDVFCAAWSRFAGSFQVIAVANAFGEGTPDDLRTLEVVASPVVTSAYDDMFANWPDELASEEVVARDDFFGPLARRWSVTFEGLGEALAGAGADDAIEDVISDAWISVLVERDPSVADVDVDLPDDAADVVASAVAELANSQDGFGEDDSLITDAATPLTDEYIVTSCPDQGSLAGQEVEG